MFQIYHSNQLALLKLLATNIIKNYPLKNPLESEIIVVPNLMVAKWLKIEFAKEINVTANIQFKLPDSFLWELFIKILPTLPKTNIFTKFHIKWFLMSIIPTILNNNIIFFKKYFSDNLYKDQQKLFKFSNYMAELLYKYLIYRYDWIKSWENYKYIVGLDEEQQHLQSFLWQEIIKYLSKNYDININYSNIQESFIRNLNISNQNINTITNFYHRIFIFGIYTLPPVYLELLQAIQNSFDVHLLLVNPCRYYWNDLLNYNFSITRSANYIEKINISNNFIKKEEISNPLLISWGRLGSEYLQILNQNNNLYQEVDAFVEVDKKSMINSIQHDLLNLQDNSFLSIYYPEIKNSSSKRMLNIIDNSISINICCSIYREVEVLHDYILTIIENDHEIKPRDILVMTSNIDEYLPFIQSVFINVSNDRFIPFSIIHENMKDNLSSVVLIFLKILKLPQTKFSIIKLLRFLEEPAIAEHFCIERNDLIFLTNWIMKKSFFRDNYTYNILEESTDKNSWRSDLVEKYIQYSGLNRKYDIKQMQLFKFLLKFLKTLEKWQQKLSIPKMIHEWQSIYLSLVNDFFNINNNNFQISRSLLEKTWYTVMSKISQISYSQQVSINLIYQELCDIIHNQNNVNELFLSGNVNFCTFNHMCAIPFKLICLLGMNENSYPRNNKLFSNFDLTRYCRRKGDYQQKIHDKYIFLETILAVEKYLYISYIGFLDYYDNTLKHNPSLLIQELVNYITQSFYLQGDEKFNLEESAKRVYDHIHHFHTKMPFDPENFLPNNSNTYHSFAKEWLYQSKTDNNQIQPFFIKKLSYKNEHKIYLKNFLNFWQHPVRYWFNRRLGINFYAQSNNFLNTEIFSIKKSTLYQINNKLLNALINNFNTNKLYLNYKKYGHIPYGMFGELFWKEQIKEMKKIAILVCNKITLRKKLNFSFKHENSFLIGQLYTLQDQGILKWTANILSIKDALILWLEHIIYCACGGKGESIMYGNKQSFWRFLPIEKEVACNELSRFIKGYKEGLMFPLLLPYKSSNTWLDVIFDKKTKNIKPDIINQKKALSSLLSTWNGNYQYKGENEDLYFQHFVNNLDSKNAIKIIEHIKEWYVPILQANQYHDN